MTKSLLATVVASFCIAGPSWAADCAPTRKLGYLTAEPKASATSVVVFIHGVLSNSHDAWTYTRWMGRNIFWPCLIAEEPAFRDTNIFLYNYPTETFTQSPSIDRVAHELRTDLVARKVFEHAHITFVAHSMGGLVLSRMLLGLQDPGLLSRVRVVMFYGTPGAGADIARAASTLSSNVQFAEMGDPQKLEKISDQWNEKRWPFRWVCLAESTRTGWFPPVMVVPQQSAAKLCRKEGAELMTGYDHVSLVKPTEPSDPPFKKFYNLFADCVAPRMQSDIPSEANTQRGQKVIGWFLEFQKLAGALQGSPKGIDLVKASLYVSPAMLANDVYAAPGIGEGNKDWAGSNVFSMWLWQQAGARIPQLEHRWVSKLSNLHASIRDHQVIEMRRKYLASGVLSENDYVLAARDPNGDPREMILVFLGFAPDTDAPRLKGYHKVILPQLGCAAA